MSVLRNWPSRCRPEEDGFAMVMAVMVATIAIVMVTMVLAMGLHLDTQTVRERRWNLALQIAELGVERDVAQINTDLTYAGDTTPTDVPGGEVATRVTALPDGAGYIIDAVGWTPSATAENAIKRRLQVVYEPEPSFQYALYSATDLFVKSSGGIDGDVFGNLDVELWNGTIVRGSVTSATGTVLLNQNAGVDFDSEGKKGDVFSGGFETSGGSTWAVRLDNNAYIQGDVHTQVPTVASPCPDATNYNVQNTNGGTMFGDVYTPGSVIGPGPAGSIITACEQRSPTKGLPEVNSSAIPGLVDITPADFEAMPTLQGKYRVLGTMSESIDFACQSIVGDFTLVTQVTVKKSNTCGSTPFWNGSVDDVIHIISENTKTDPSDPAVDVENSLELPAAPNPSPAFLLYSKGFCDLKNSVVSSGAVYCNGINIKNSLSIRYDERIERVLGFGTTLFERSSFRELAASTPL